jgi:hypothetical protein
VRVCSPWWYPLCYWFGNPAPDAELTSVGAENFEWVVEESAKWLLLLQKNKSLENESYMGNFYERRSNSEINFRNRVHLADSPRGSGETSMSFKKRGGLYPHFGTRTAWLQEGIALKKLKMKNYLLSPSVLKKNIKL